MQGILAPLKGKTITCSGYGVYGAMVDSNGNPYVNNGAGWVAGFTSASPSYGWGSGTFTTWSFNSYPSLIVTYYDGNAGTYTTSCTANWPPT